MLSKLYVEEPSSHKGRSKKFISYQGKRPLMAIMHDLELDRYEKLMAKEMT